MLIITDYKIFPNMKQNIKTELRRTGRPTLDEAASLTDIILDAAKRLFCDKGYGAASMDEIAAASDVTKLTIYRRFPSKEALLIAMIDRELNQFTLSLPPFDKNISSPMEMLEQTARSMFYFSILPDSLKMRRLLIIEAFSNIQLQERMDDWWQRASQPAMLAIEAAQQSGDIVNDDPASLAEMMWDILDRLPRWLRCHGALSTEEQVSEDFFRERWVFFKRAVTPHP